MQTGKIIGGGHTLNDDFGTSPVDDHSNAFSRSSDDSNQKDFNPFTDDGDEEVIKV